jgi:1-acyl-sn-glycerol-3-phosphate acyltransferase
MGKIAMYILILFGWKIDKHTPEGVDKCVVVMGPHTSNWDFIIGRLAFASYGVNGHYLIKKELFFFSVRLVFKIYRWNSCR